MDENNNKSGFIYNGAYYYYVFNGQGDVMGIINNSGTMMAKYTYDAWGKVLSVTDGNGVVQSSSSFIGNINPIRYRGYYYDTETGLYYLQSRYYDPETGRFVNADGYVQTGTGSVFDKNMYAYCLNDPVNMVDSTGKFGESYMADCHYYYDESAPYNIPVPESAKEVVSTKQLKDVGFKNVSPENVKSLNVTLKSNGITSPTLIAHFLAQCAYETNLGTWLTELGSEAYFSNKAYGYKYRGAGYIQITWDYNYRDFAKAMGDQEIYNQGADYVATNYAWQAAGWWWSNNNMNDRITNGASVKDVTRVVRGSSSTWEDRQTYYNKFIGIFG